MSAIDDRFRSLPGKDEDRGVPTACCPRDGEPLICTMERRGAEFHCMICGGWFGFLAPVEKYESEHPDLATRYAYLRARFDAGDRGPLPTESDPT